jgi:peptidoglycan/xylan/chitin deacetylase (PgdA/CDA1 family)
MASKKRAAVTVDFELFRHTPAFRSANGTLTDDSLGLEAAEYLLDVFDDADATATFFIVSEVANEYPEVIKRISNAGHEIASHTHTHQLLPEIKPSDRYEELRLSRQILEQVTNQSVSGIRAPAFELYDGYFRDLNTAGYEYDSSVNPCRAIPGWYGGDYDVRRSVSTAVVDPSAPSELVEVPIAVSPYIRLPVGGAWMRLLGRKYTLWGTQTIAARGIPPVIYTHPWEFVDLPEIAGVPRRVTWRTGNWMCETLERILALPLDFVSVAKIASDAGYRQQ